MQCPFIQMFICQKIMFFILFDIIILYILPLFNQRTFTFMFVCVYINIFYIVFYLKLYYNNISKINEVALCQKVSPYPIHANMKSSRLYQNYLMSLQKVRNRDVKRVG